jgi:hypothetical protein
MAGRGEFCGHVGSLLQGVALTVSSLGISSTSRPNAWIVPRASALDLAPKPLEDVIVFFHLLAVIVRTK